MLRIASAAKVRPAESLSVLAVAEEGAVAIVPPVTVNVPAKLGDTPGATDWDAAMAPTVMLEPVVLPNVSTKETGLMTSPERTLPAVMEEPLALASVSWVAVMALIYQAPDEARFVLVTGCPTARPTGSVANDSTGFVVPVLTAFVCAC